MMTVSDPPLLSPAQPHAASSQHLDYVDTLRGFACLWVLLIHSYNSAKGQHMMAGLSAFSPIRFLFDFSSLGWLGVNLFLVLSGFCLFLPLVHKNAPDRVSLKLGEFARRRAHRILPPYYIALLVLVVLESVPLFHLAPPFWGEFRGFRDVLLHVLMLHNFQPDTIDSINIVFWSLALETQLYFLFPLLVLSVRKIGMTRTVAAVFVLSVAWQILIYPYDVALSPIYTVLYRAVPSRCFEFAGGMLAATLVARPHPYQTRTALVVALALLPWSVWGAAHAVQIPVLVTQAWGIIFVCLLLLGSRVPLCWLQHRAIAALTFVGTISYSVYLVHMPVFYLFYPHRLHWHPSAGGIVAFDTLRLFIAVSFGYLFYLIAERPFINRKKAPAVSPAVPKAL